MKVLNSNTLIKQLLIIIIICVSGALVAERTIAQSLRMFSNDAGLFNPSNGSITIRYQLFNDATEVKVRIIDFRGQVANSLTFINLRAGDQSFHWDGNNNNGERVIDGRYQFRIMAQFDNGTKDLANVDVMVATLKSDLQVQLPEPLPAEEFSHTISGSLSIFNRYNKELEDIDEGEMRFRTAVDYKDDSRTVKASFQAIQDFEGSSTDFDGTQVMAEQLWQGGKAKAVYHENLGNFDDPFQLFSDFKTEREKVGLSANQVLGKFTATGIVFSAEGEDVDNEEKGAAARFTYGDKNSFIIGTSTTFRNAIDDLTKNAANSSNAVSADILYSVTNALSVAAQIVTTNDDSEGQDFGSGIKGDYDSGVVRLSAGYTDLGEHFKADFGDPLHHVDRDARGFDAGIDYFMPNPVWIFNTVSTTLRYFNLTRHSDDSTVEEIDGSIRFGIGENDTFFTSIFSREDEYGKNSNYMWSVTHKWNEALSNMLQANYSETDQSDSQRITFSTNYKQEDIDCRFSLEWSKRTIDYSKFSPYEQSYIRVDLSNELWHLQLQGKYLENGEKSGFNLFGRLDYKPEFLHRYQLVTYVSLGNRSAVETEKQFEFGLEVQF